MHLFWCVFTSQDIFVSFQYSCSFAYALKSIIHLDILSGRLTRKQPNQGIQLKMISLRELSFALSLLSFDSAV
jgi:hypothetical protein